MAEWDEFGLPKTPVDLLQAIAEGLGLSGKGGTPTARAGGGIPTAPFDPSSMLSGGASSRDPEDEEKFRQTLFSFGLDERQAQIVLDMLPDAQDRFMSGLVTRQMTKEQKATEEAGKPKYNREALTEEFPDYRSIIMAAPEGSLANIASGLVSDRRNARNKPLPKPEKLGAYQINRGNLPASIRDQAQYMTDSDISGFMRKELEGKGKNDPSGIGYRDRKGGAGLKIIQDASFQRSGLKSGDTVCVRIP